MLFHCIACNSSFIEIMTGTQGRVLEAGTEQGPWQNAAYRLFPHGFLSLLSFTPWNYLPRVTQSQERWTHTHRMLIKKYDWQFTYRQSWWRHFLSWDSLCPNGCILCQVDIKLPGTVGKFLDAQVEGPKSDSPEPIYILPNQCQIWLRSSVISVLLCWDGRGSQENSQKFMGNLARSDKTR